MPRHDMMDAECLSYALLRSLYTGLWKNMMFLMREARDRGDKHVGGF